MDAGELVLGERVRKLDGSYGTVNALKSVHKPQGMYNLTVEGAHTFFVGDGQWLVHNAGGTGCDGSIRGAAAGLGRSGGDTAGRPIPSELRQGDLAANRAANSRDNYWCTHCGFESQEARHFDDDHIISRSQGGNLDPANRRILCVGCNRSAQEGWPPKSGSDWATKHPGWNLR